MSSFYEKTIPLATTFKTWLSATFAPFTHTEDTNIHLTKEEVLELIAANSFTPIPYENMGPRTLYAANTIYTAPCDGYLIPLISEGQQMFIYGSRADRISHRFNTSLTASYNYAPHKAPDGTLYQANTSASIPNSHAYTNTTYWRVMEGYTPAMLISSTSYTGSADSGIGSWEYIPVKKDDCFAATYADDHKGATAVWLGNKSWYARFVPLNTADAASNILVYKAATSSYIRVAGDTIQSLYGLV